MSLQGDNGGWNRNVSPRSVFGVPAILAPADAIELLTSLEQLFKAQVLALKAIRPDIVESRRPDRLEEASLNYRPPDRNQLVADLELLRAWFDPTAKGARVREAVSCVPPLRVSLAFDDSLLIVHVGSGGRIVTPEGRALISCLRAAISEHQAASPGDRGAADRDWLRLRDDDIAESVLALLSAYRKWTRRRLEDVVELLTSEPSTLRPAAAGLLLTLLINRNTDRSRALPRPNDRRHLEAISEAIAGPAIAYATTLTGTHKTDDRSLDLYRGWPLGELRRRMGVALHSGLGDGIYLEPEAVEDAVRRLVLDIRRRPPRLRARVPQALEAALHAYEDRRPQLAGLGLAFESPGLTRRLLDTLRDAAISDSDSGAGEGPSVVREAQDSEVRQARD